MFLAVLPTLSVPTQQPGPLSECDGPSHCCDGHTLVALQRTFNITNRVHLPPHESGPVYHCSYLVQPGQEEAPDGLTLSFLRLQLPCDTPAAQEFSVRVYDGWTTLSPLIMQYTCGSSWLPVHAGGDSLLVVVAFSLCSGYTCDGVSGRCRRDCAFDLELSWSPSAPACGNGVCERTGDGAGHNEYGGRCAADCGEDLELPPFSDQYRDTKWCEAFDTLQARGPPREPVRDLPIHAMTFP